MKRWQKRVLVTLAVLVVVGFPAYWWLFLTAEAPDGQMPLDLAAVRALASSLPGDKPTEVRVDRVADFVFPSGVMVAGDGWTMVDCSVYAYQLVYADRRVVVDVGPDEKSLAGAWMSPHGADAVARVRRAMDDASLILATHEHFDHLGGLTTAPNVDALLAKAKLNPEQFTNRKGQDPAPFPDKVGEGYQPLAYDGMTAVAPGVVLIRSPGHTPGSQLVYVQRADGVELLFLGDVAWSERNVDVVRERPRLVTFALGEDRAAVLKELAALHELKAKFPDVHQVPGHDRGPVDALVKQGLLVEGFVSER